DLPRDTGDGVNQGDQLGDIVDVCRGQNPRERYALRICDEVMFTPCFPPIRRARTRFFPPNTARTEELSTIALDQSILSDSRSFESITSCISCQTPASDHSRRYRQQDIPEPHPISCGSISQGMPLLSTKRMPVRALRGGIGLRPGKRSRRGFGG